MVVGQPLHYHYPYSASLSEVYFPLVAPMEPEDYPMITSPSNSTQSDSDNSLSSIEVPSHSIAIPKKEEKKQCLWKNCGAIFQSLTELASHVGQCHSAGGPDGLFHCGWEGCSRNNKGFNARYTILLKNIQKNRRVSFIKTPCTEVFLNRDQLSNFNVNDCQNYFARSSKCTSFIKKDL